MITKQEAQRLALENLTTATSNCMPSDIGLTYATIAQAYATLALSLDPVPVANASQRFKSAMPQRLELVEFEEDEGQEDWAG